MSYVEITAVLMYLRNEPIANVPCNRPGRHTRQWDLPSAVGAVGTITVNHMWSLGLLVIDDDQADPRPHPRTGENWTGNARQFRLVHPVAPWVAFAADQWIAMRRATGGEP